MKSRLSSWVSLVVLIAGMVLLLVLAVFLVNREDASSVASASETAMVADNALGVVTAIRTASTYSAGYIMKVGVDRQALGLLDEIDSALVELDSRINRLATTVDTNLVASELREAQSRFATTTVFLSAELAKDTGQIDMYLEEQGAAMTALTGLLVDIRDDNVRSVLVAGADLGRVANAVRFLVIFVIPLAMIIGLWRIQRRLSERRLLAAEVEKQRQIADSKDAFVADVSHELRTPLTGIYGFAVALEEGSTNLNEFQAELLSLIITESAELERMVDDLVALGRLDAGAVSYQIMNVDVEGIVEQVIAPFRRMGISFENEVEGLVVRADPARFRQVVRNLLSNAVKYGDGEVAVGVLRRDSAVVVEVMDNGPGVPDHVVERLFERYVHSGAGTAVVEGSVGLGLAIAQSLAEGMGGSLRYVRENDVTIFQLALPIGQTADRPLELQAG